MAHAIEAQAEVYSVEDVVRMTRLQPPTIRAKIARGDFPRGFMLNSRTRRWLKTEIDGWLAEKRGTSNAL